MIKKMLPFILVLFVPVSLSFAQLLDEDLERFIKNNPDGKKYDFVKDYLKSLKYLEANAQRSKKIEMMEKNDFSDAETLQTLITSLKQDNVNLRIARSLLRGYHSPDNGLMLKVTDLFTKVCDEQIEFNKKERALLEEMDAYFTSQKKGDFDFKAFAGKQYELSAQRKDSLYSLLEASLLVNKVMVSTQMDYNGDLTVLGITNEERDKLLEFIDEFYQENYYGELREGQTFLEGSVSAIRSVLEDYSWDTLDS